MKYKKNDEKSLQNISSTLKIKLKESNISITDIIKQCKCHNWHSKSDEFCINKTNNSMDSFLKDILEKYYTDNLTSSDNLSDIFFNSRISPTQDCIKLAEKQQEKGIKFYKISCICRELSDNDCSSTDVCLIIGEFLAETAKKYKDLEVTEISSKDVKEVLVSENAKGHVHQVFYSSTEKYYAICNCCPCCCSSLNPADKSEKKIISSGYIAKVDHTACIGCGQCLSYCSFGAMNISCKKMRISALKCTGCGVCITKCRYEALSLIRNMKHPAPLSF